MPAKRTFLDRIHAPGWLVLTLAITFLLRIPSLFEPYYYGDEMIYLNMGEAIKRGMVLYRDIHDNKPPLLYVLAGLAGNVFWFRAILAGWMMATTFVFWKLVQNLFPKNEIVVKTSVAVFAILTTIPLLEGQIANAELFMISPTITAFWLLLTRKLNIKNLLLAGCLFSVSTLFKVPAAFDMGAIIFLWIVSLKRRGEIASLIKQTAILLVGFAVPILATIVWYYLRGAFSEYLVAAFLQNIGYLSSWRPSGEEVSFLAKNGPLLVRGGVLLTGLAILWVFRARLSKRFIFAVSWLLFSLFAAVLSERPYPHYLIQVVPAVSLLAGFMAGARSAEQSLAIAPIFLLLLTVVRYQFWYYPTIPYYQRFVQFAGGQINKDEYINAFDKNTSRNYKLAEYLVSSSSPDEKVFVWGDSPGLYALSKRLPPIKYVADYHIVDFSSQEEVLRGLNANRPKFIVVLPGSRPFPALTSFLRSYLLIETIDGAKIWKSLNLR